MNKAKRQTTPIYCPHCAKKKGGRPKILCAVDENRDIIIRCKDCKSEVNVSALVKEKSNNI